MAKKQRANSTTRRRGPGRPFTKNDPRINRLGRKPKGETLAEAVRRIGDAEYKPGVCRWDALVLAQFDAAIEDRHAGAADWLSTRAFGRVAYTIEASSWQAAYAASIRSGSLTWPALCAEFSETGAARVAQDIVRSGAIGIDELRGLWGVEVVDGLFSANGDQHD